MIRRALLLTLAMTGLASAQPQAQPAADPPPVARMTQPAGWILDPPGGSRIAAGLGADGLFAGAPISVDAQVWTAPSHHAVLVTTQVSTDQLPADPDAAANATLHEIRAGADAVDGAAIDRWIVTVDPAGKLHEASLTWRDPSVGTTTIIRALVFRTGGALARIAGECVIGPDGAGDRAACEQALTTIAPAAAALEPVAVTAAAPAAAAPPTEPMPGSGAKLGSGAPPSLRDGADVPATVMVRPPPQQTDRRPLYLVAGIAVLGLVFLWNRRERQRREAAERAEEARRNRRRGKAGADEAADAADGDDADAAGKADAADAAADADDADAGADAAAEPTDAKDKERDS